MNKPMPPCGINMDCPKRTSSCHSDCIDYLFYQAKNEAWSESIRKDKEIRQAPVERGVKLSKYKNRHRDWRK